MVYFGFANKLIVWDYTQQSQNANARGANRSNPQYLRQVANHKHGQALTGQHSFPQQITCIKELTC